MLFLTAFFLLISCGFSQKEGDACTDRYTNTQGRCKPTQACVSAREDLNNNGISPTFCSYSFNQALVCCRDGSNILRVPERRPVSTGNRNKVGQKRLSERKCEEYSSNVIQTVDFLPLLPEPEKLSISSAKCDYTKIELIVGGENANQGEFPHMAAIGWVENEDSYVFLCGGSLISSRFILTAGHCIKTPRRRPDKPSIVRLGDQNLDPTVQDRASPVDVPIKNIIPHPEYRAPNKYNDIALLELHTDVDFENNIRPACLWTKPDFAGHTKALATGWGVTNPNSRNPESSNELQKVSLTLLENAYCDRLLFDSQNRHWKGFVPTQMCAGELRGGKDTCQGDSGSPLQVASSENQCIFHVVGVTSFGRKCAQSGKPAIYTRVSSYLDWIESVVWPGEN